MKILHLSTSDTKGGASIAAYRTHKALLHQEVDSIMYVMEKSSNDPTVISFNQNPWTKFGNFTKKTLSFLICRLFRAKNRTIYSAELFSRIDINLVKKINPDIIQLHWVCGNFIKPSDVKKLSYKPLVWTMHDMWPFTGSEHYTAGNKRYEERYTSKNKPSCEKGLDICKIVWWSKEKNYAQITRMNLVSPSIWLADCASKSMLLKRFPITIILNGLDTETFKPYDKKRSREILGLPQDSQLILFGAGGGTYDPRKGFSYLEKALEIISNKNNLKIELIIFGQEKPKDNLSNIFSTHYLGTITSEKDLALAYSAADVFVVPSTEDNLPNTILESLSCGTPVVGFNIGGIPDMVTHEINGYLAKPLDSDDLALGIMTILNKNPSEYSKISENARITANEKFSLVILAKNYISLYDKILKPK